MAYSVDLRQRILGYVDAGHSKAEAAEKYKVHRTTVGRLLQQRAAGQSLRADKPKGRKRKIESGQSGQAQLLKAQVEAHSDDTLEQHCERWFQEQGVRLSVKGMHRSLKRYKLTRKKDLQSR